jgi:uncharacterized membrane protein
MTRRRIFNIVLVCSLALNLLIVGAVIGRIAFGHPPGPPLAWALQDLDEKTRNKFQTNFKHQAKVVAPLRKEIRAARRDFKTLLEEEDLDEKASHAALARLRQASSQYTYALHGQMISMLKELEPQQRIRVSRYLMRPRPHTDASAMRTGPRGKRAD